MKQRVPNIKRITKEDEEKIRLAEEIKNLLPHVTDDIHMKAALALKCEYKVIESYLAGNIEDADFAQAIIEMLRIIIERIYDDSNENYPGENTESFITKVGELSMLTHRKCKAIIEQLHFLEKINHESFGRLQASVNEIARKVGAKAC